MSDDEIRPEDVCDALANAEFIVEAGGVRVKFRCARVRVEKHVSGMKSVRITDAVSVGAPVSLYSKRLRAGTKVEWWHRRRGETAQQLWGVIDSIDSGIARVRLDDQCFDASRLRVQVVEVSRLKRRES